MKENINMSIDKKISTMARLEAKATKRTFSLFIEWVLQNYFQEKKK